MKQQLQYQAERLRLQIEELQQILRRTRFAVMTITEEIEDIEETPAPDDTPHSNI